MCIHFFGTPCIYPSDSQESDGGAGEQLPRPAFGDAFGYCCSLEIFLFSFFSFIEI